MSPPEGAVKPVPSGECERNGVELIDAMKQSPKQSCQPFSPIQQKNFAKAFQPSQSFSIPVESPTSRITVMPS